MLEVFRFALFAVRTFFGVITAHPRARCRNVGVREGSFGCDGQRGSGRHVAAREVVQRAGNRLSGSKGRGGFARRKEQLRWRALELRFEKDVNIVAWLRFPWRNQTLHLFEKII